MEKCRRMTDLYLSHEHLDEVIADYVEAIRSFFNAKADVAEAQSELDEAEAHYYSRGLIYSQADKSQGTNDAARKLYARKFLADKGYQGALDGANLRYIYAESEYEVMRKELDAFRLHLQLQGLILKEQELLPPIVQMRSPIVGVQPISFYGEFAPGEEAAMLKAIRAKMENLATGLEQYGEVDQGIAADIRAIINEEKTEEE